MVRGSHCLAHWSRTQSTIALSSGEAELNAALKGATEAIGARTLMGELGMGCDIVLWGDSSACSGTLHREGAGRVKHLELKQLWLQQRIRKGEVDYHKIPRQENPADSLCKPWSKDGWNHFWMMGFVFNKDSCKWGHASEGGLMQN